MLNCFCNDKNEKIIEIIITLLKTKKDCNDECECLLCNQKNLTRYCGTVELFTNKCEMCKEQLCSHCNYFNKNKCLQCSPY